MNRKKILLSLKSMCITLCVFLFAGAMFIAMNESQRSLNGRAIYASLSSNGFQISIGDDMWVIEPNTEWIRNTTEFLCEHSGMLPIPIQILYQAFSFHPFDM